MEKKKWDEPIWNIGFIVVGSLIGLLISSLADLSGAGMAALVFWWLPVIVGAVGLLLYLLSRLFFKKYNWVISLLFVMFLLTLALQLHNANFGG